MMSSKEVPQLAHQMIIGWKIWYTHDTVDSTQMAWKDAPLDDVQVVMVYFEILDGLKRPTRLASSGCDVYIMNEAKGTFASHFEMPAVYDGDIKNGKYMNLQALEKKEREAFDDFGEGWLWQGDEQSASKFKEKMEM